MCLNDIPCFFSNHLKSNSRNMINRYGLRVSVCMVPWLIAIWGVVPNGFQ